MFADLGCQVLDSDLITHQLFAAGEAVNQAVADAFGPSVVAADGSIDRRVLGELVFNDSSLRQKLNAIVHPAIRQRQDAFVEQAGAENPKAIAMIEAALMIEAGTSRNYDKLIVVTCPVEEQRRRLGERSKLTAEQIESRIASQMPMSEKVKQADFVVDNSGTLESTREQVEGIYRQLRSMADA
jgi:dephospho-CoA kinase